MRDALTELTAVPVTTLAEITVDVMRASTDPSVGVTPAGQVNRVTSL